MERSGHHIVYERPGQRLALRTVDHPFQEGLANPLDDAAVHLPGR